MQVSIQAKHLCKTYQLKDPVTGRPYPFQCLDDVNFVIEKGSCVGLKGQNGAGKSTLLKIISNIIRPSSGHVSVKGTVAPMLDLGAGFHDELTGRENAFIYASLMGIKRGELKRQFDDIIDFAEIGAFVDTKLRRYSSGMKFRLAFSIASTLKPDIILADEILAIGDEEFQNRCLNRILELKQSGTTILIVQHNEVLLKRICDRALLLENKTVSHCSV